MNRSRGLVLIDPSIPRDDEVRADAQQRDIGMHHTIEVTTIRPTHMNDITIQDGSMLIIEIDPALDNRLGLYRIVQSKSPVTSHEPHTKVLSQYAIISL